MQSNGCTEDTEGLRPEAMVQGGMGGCPIREALWQTKGRKKRNTLLQAIKACKRKNPCYCQRDVRKSKAVTDIGEEEARSTSGEAQESQTSKEKIDG